MKEAQIYIIDYKNLNIARMEIYDKELASGKLGLSKTIKGDFTKLDNVLKRLSKIRDIHITTFLGDDSGYTFVKGKIGSKLQDKYHTF